MKFTVGPFEGRKKSNNSVDRLPNCGVELS